jgi:Glycosyl transferase family 2
MSGLRFLGVIAALAFLLFAFRGYGRRRVSRLSLILAIGLALIVIALAIWPNTFNFVFNTFNFQAKNAAGNPDHGRLIFALLIAVVILFFLVLRAQSYSDANERSMRLLVEALGLERFDWEAAAALPEGPRLVTVSPAFNEAENVAAVIHAIPETLDGYRVIPVVVSDGSEDRTAQVARDAGALVTELPIRRGGGLALRVGYDIALKLGADIVVTIDADGQHRPEELAVMIEPIVRGDADYVNGSRLLGTFERESLIRHMGVHFFSRFITVLTGRRITDPSSGYRAARADLLQRLVLEQDQFWTSEILIEALRHKARVQEVPVTIESRKGGKSKKPKSLKYGYYFSKVIIQTWLR